MAKDPAFLMYYKEWLVSTAGWDADVRGWYINLLCHQADKRTLEATGLPNDIETLAELAGVKISQFDRFKECWKRTLEAKFKLAEDGTLINSKMDMVLKDRREFTNKQSIRGLLGYYIKLARKAVDLSDRQAEELYRHLEKEDFPNKNKKERLESLKRTLQAIINSNVNIDSISLTKGEKQIIKNSNGIKFSGNYKAQGEELWTSGSGGIDHQE
jgi:hypothetical protein